MGKFYDSQSSSLLVIQPQPFTLRKINQAVLTLNCRVNTVNDETELLRFSHQYSKNPFGIFGHRQVSCMVFDMGGSEKKTEIIFEKLAENKGSFPPVIGLLPSARFKSAYISKANDFAEMVVGPSSTQTLRKLLEKYISYPFTDNEYYGYNAPEQSPEEMPVINLKTFYLLSELSEKQEFSLRSLWAIWLKELDSFCEGLESSFENEDFCRCSKYCNAIKSLAGTLGALQIAIAAKHLGKKLKDNRWSEAAYWLPVIRDRILVLEKYLSALPSENTPQPVLI